MASPNVYDVHQMGNTGARLFVPPFLDPYEPNIDPILIQSGSFIGQAMMNRLISEGKQGVVTNGVYAPGNTSGARVSALPRRGPHPH